MPMPPVVNVGFYNFVVSSQIVALVGCDSAPVRRLIQQLRNSPALIDATQGRKTKCVIFTAGQQVILSAIGQETLARRLSSTDAVAEDE